MVQQNTLVLQEEIIKFSSSYKDKVESGDLIFEWLSRIYGLHGNANALPSCSRRRNRYTVAHKRTYAFSEFVISDVLYVERNVAGARLHYLNSLSPRLFAVAAQLIFVE
jgi:hypothetical protein